MFKECKLLLFFFTIHANASAIEVTVNDQDKKPIAEAVVFLTNNEQPLPPPDKNKSIVDQIDKEFVNRVTVVRTGSMVSFPNHDQIRHHIYSFSPAKIFEIPLYKEVTPQPILFDKPGAVVLGCNIHDWMKGYIYVVSTPYFAKTVNTGKAKIDIPSGKYTLNVWHSQLKTSDAIQVKTFNIGTSETLSETISIELKPDFHAQRISIGRGMLEGDYH